MKHPARAILCALAGVACSDPEPVVLPPLGEVVVVVDTDAPVPELVGRLRVDFFDKAGAWFDSRDVLRAEPQAWPAMFSVYTDDLTHEKSVILRIRAYTEGRTRRYEGERPAPGAYVEPPVAYSLMELCENAPELKLGEALTLRRGRAPLTGALSSDSCALPVVRGGAAAARLTVPSAGRYRIETLSASPPELETLLLLRKDCLDLSSQIACSSQVVEQRFTSIDYLGRLELELEPGVYSVLALAYQATPIDLTLKADLASAWHSDEQATSEPPAPLPRLLRGGVDDTPDEEPDPQLTIDRLVRLRITPGSKQLASITLHAQCTGTMARLSDAGSFADLVPLQAASCIDDEGERQRLAEEPLVPFEELPTQSRVDHFAVDEPCDASSSDDSRACIPGGQFVLGTPSVVSTTGRFAVMHRFWMDRDEVTVERWRAAVARGFVSPDASPAPNELRYVTSLSDPNMLSCTYSTRPLAGAASRERYPVTCLGWYDARAFCQFEGGDLPSEAEWEYAALRAGRPRGVLFPWSSDVSDVLDCDRAIFGRFPALDVSSCGDRGFGVVSIDDPAYARDTTPLGVRGLSGNASEWVLDSWAPTLDTGCWRNATITDPLCWEREAPKRSVRGGSAFSRPGETIGGLRRSATPQGTIIGYVGLRCVYQEPR